MNRTHAYRSALAALAVLAGLAASAQEVLVKPLSLLAGAQCIYPTVRDSVLYFASNVKWDVGKIYLNQQGEHMYQIFRVPLRDKLPEGHARPWLPGDGRPFNMFAICFDGGGGAIVTQNSLAGEASAVSGAAVTMYNYSETGNRGERLANLPDKASSGMAALSPDGRTLVFTSDADGGHGRNDLYLCSWTRAGWSEPRNLGEQINTKGMETAPMFHRSGKLFFASNGRKDSKGLDIYYTTLAPDGTPEPPKRLDDGINSPLDDYGLFYSDDERWGYVCSNRGGKERLYFFKRDFPEFPECKCYQPVNLCYELYEASAESYDATQIECKWTFGDGQNAYGVSVEHCYDGPGNYNVELNIVDKSSGEEMFSLAQYELEIPDPNQINIECPVFLKVGQSVTFKANARSLKGLKPRDYYWDLGNGQLETGPQVTATYRETGTYTVKCGTIDVANKQLRHCTWVDVYVR